MSDTDKHKRAWQERQTGDHKFNLTPDFDGRRYGNKRKAVAQLKVKDRRRRNRVARRNLDEFDSPGKRKHIME